MQCNADKSEFIWIPQVKIGRVLRERERERESNQILASESNHFGGVHFYRPVKCFRVIL